MKKEEVRSLILVEYNSTKHLVCSIRFGQYQRARKRIDTRQMAALTLKVKREREESKDLEYFTDNSRSACYLSGSGKGCELGQRLC